MIICGKMSGDKLKASASIISIISVRKAKKKL